MRMGLVQLGLICALTIGGCQMRENAPDMAVLTVDFSWSSKHKCSSTSPAFKISGIPPETGFLEISMTDLNSPSYNHGSGVVEYRGSGNLPEGAFSSPYKGPCPPNGSTHDYEFRVKAINKADDMVLATGRGVRPFPPK